MQQAPDGTVILSATDLVGYLACDHLATLELGRVVGRWERPIRRDDPTIELIQAKGDLHEATYLAELRASGKSVVEIPKADLRTPDDLRAAQAQTVQAMHDGADVVFQATFFDGRWRGHADFLFKRDDRPSPRLGSWSYDIADTKLARSVKGGAILQMCVYAALLEGLQGIAPEWLEVITGDRVRHAYRADAFAAYFRSVKTRFEARVAAGLDGPATPTYPDPVDHCRICSWFPMCIERRRDDDHPSIVAGLGRLDTERLQRSGIVTLTGLAELPAGAPVKDLRTGRLDRLRNQARLQLHERRTGERVWELTEPDPDEPGRGLMALPEPSPWDLFFDIEADPWATDVGLEYLLGVVDAVDGEPVYQAIWATDQDEERLAFQRFLDLVVERLDAHPEMHVYHYGGYEAGAIKRLMARHGVGQDQVDRLLRGDVLVDLLNVVRQGIRGSVESYSLKQVEKSYMPVREGPVTEAGFSVVAFERWLQERDRSILEGIADYNRDDCISTYLLRAWLEGWRTEAIRRWPGLDWTRPVAVDGTPSEGVSDWLRDVGARESALIDAASDEPDAPLAAGQRLLADLLDWHRREEKSQWWRWYELRTDLTIEQLVNERDALAGLSFLDETPLPRNMLQRRYRFEPQDHGFDPGDSAVDRDTGKGAGTVVDIDEVNGVITLKRSANSAWPHPLALIGAAPIDSVVLKRAMLRVADAVLEDGIDGDGAFRAVRDLILRRAPRGTVGPNGGSLQGPGEDVTLSAIRLGRELASGVLPIQGPPGTGKTYTAARMILDLVAAGRTVGVTAQSHKTISNLLEAIGQAIGTDHRWRTPRVLQRASPDNDHAGNLPFVTLADNADVEAAVASRSVDIVAGTPWLFARPAMEAAIDVLVVDEAGQMSTANVVAMGTSARSIVLVGDPNQLPMVSQGVHPEGAGRSALEHLVGEDAATVEPDRGLFLGTTRRLHPSVGDYISRTFYDGLLTSHPDTARQVIGGDDLLSGAGLRWVPVSHTANGPRSREEAAVVVDLVERLIGRRWTSSDGETSVIELDDILIVAPYNAQVAEIQATLTRRLGTRGNVGTVDKFQGREGAVSIYSMASSSREDAPRDMGFLYSRNRLNVAVSRARSLAIVVASPRLLEAGCRTPDQMHAMDALCALVEMATTA